MIALRRAKSMEAVSPVYNVAYRRDDDRPATWICDRYGVKQLGDGGADVLTAATGVQTPGADF